MCKMTRISIYDIKYLVSMDIKYHSQGQNQMKFIKIYDLFDYISNPKKSLVLKQFSDEAV